MERLDLLFFCIPVATLAVALGVIVGVAYLTERAIAPAPAIVFEPQAPLVTTEVP